MSSDLNLLFSNFLFVSKDLHTKKIKKSVPYLKGVLLDMGCGKKPYKRFLKCKEYVGMELKTTLSPEPEVVGEAVSLPFATSTFDSIVCTEILEHLREPEKGIKEIKRVLKKEGVVYITVPMSWCLHYEPNDYYRFTKYGLKYLIEKNGLEILTLERIGGAFSLIGIRLIDVVFTGIVNWLFFLRTKIRVIIAMTFIIPLSVLFYVLGLTLDPIDNRDALGWALLARKRKE